MICNLRMKVKVGGTAHGKMEVVDGVVALLFKQSDFDALFELIPGAEDKPKIVMLHHSGGTAVDKPADPDSVTVGRETVQLAIHFLESGESAPGVAAELRAALGEKACDHKDWALDCVDGVEVLKCPCGATRTLGDWQKPEQK